MADILLTDDWGVYIVYKVSSKEGRAISSSGMEDDIF